MKKMKKLNKSKKAHAKKIRSFDISFSAKTEERIRDLIWKEIADHRASYSIPDGDLVLALQIALGDHKGNSDYRVYFENRVPIKGRPFPSWTFVGFVPTDTLRYLDRDT